jgi:hypothetical protein
VSLAHSFAPVLAFEPGRITGTSASIESGPAARINTPPSLNRRTIAVLVDGLMPFCDQIRAWR